jgi:hypothetical protein
MDQIQAWFGLHVEIHDAVLFPAFYSKHSFYILVVLLRYAQRWGDYTDPCYLGIVSTCSSLEHPEVKSWIRKKDTISSLLFTDSKMNLPKAALWPNQSCHELPNRLDAIIRRDVLHRL